MRLSLTVFMMSEMYECRNIRENYDFEILVRNAGFVSIIFARIPSTTATEIFPTDVIYIMHSTMICVFKIEYARNMIIRHVGVVINLLSI